MVMLCNLSGTHRRAIIESIQANRRITHLYQITDSINNRTLFIRGRTEDEARGIGSLCFCLTTRERRRSLQVIQLD